MTTEKTILGLTTRIPALRAVISITAPVTLALALTACGGGGSSSVSPVAVPGLNPELNGVVADGYLIGATICLDTNQNKMCDPDEPQAISGNGGKYSITLNDSSDADACIIAEVPDYAIDEDDGAQVGTPYVLYAPAGKHQFISPLTTLIQLLMENDPALTVDEAERIIMEAIGYYDEDNISAFDDYVDEEDDEDISADEYARIHNIARIMVKAMSQNYLDIFGIEAWTEAERLEFYNNISHRIIENLHYIIDEIDISEGDIESIDMETLLDRFTVISLLNLQNPYDNSGSSGSGVSFSGAVISSGYSGFNFVGADGTELIPYDVNVEVMFGNNSSWSGTWNADYVSGQVGLIVTDGTIGSASLELISGEQITTNDGTIYSGTVEASFYGSNAEVIGGVVDIVKTVEPLVCIVCDGNNISYEEQRYVDAFVAEAD